MNYLIVIGFAIFAVWLIRWDTSQRSGISPALWIPTLWVAIISSRPVSAWLHLGAPGDTLEGSPIDRLFYFGMIVAALIILAGRRVPWSHFFFSNWPVLLFYVYLLVTVIWANSPLTSLKRWIKEFGNILIILVILTEANPLQALRTVFVRCAYVFIPLSIIFVRYFPELGRRYGMHRGDLEVTGVTSQKNALGTMILVCGIMLFWDWLEKNKSPDSVRSRLERFLPLSLAAMGAWLLYLCQSKTSMLSLALAGLIIFSVRLPLLRSRIRALGFYSLIVVGAFAALDSTFGLTERIVSSLGRDMTFTGRTDVWRELLKLPINPTFGTGFMSLWDDMEYRAMLPKFVAFSAHNGYLEIYLAGGVIAVALLAILILATAARINRALLAGSDYALVRFAILVAALIANLAESNFGSMTPLGFLFLVAAIGHAQPETAGTASVPTTLRATGENSRLIRPSSVAFRW